MFEIDPLLKPLLVGCVFGLLWALEASYPMFVSKVGRLKHDAPNITLGVLNAVLAGFIFASLVSSVTAWAVDNQFGLLNVLSLNPVAEMVIGLMIFDCWHRLNHRVEFFWRFHAVHHCDAVMDASSAVRFHTVEITLLQFN